MVLLQFSLAIAAVREIESWAGNQWEQQEVPLQRNQGGFPTIPHTLKFMRTFTQIWAISEFICSFNC